MAKIKHSFLKNSLQLFCYRNVLNENNGNIYSKYDNCVVDSDDDNNSIFGIEEERSKKGSSSDKNKRKLTISTAETNVAESGNKPSSSRFAIVQTPLGAAKQEGKKMQNIYIHYTDSSRQHVHAASAPPPPDVIQSSSTKTIPPSAAPSHSPKSPQSKHAKQELPDIVKTNETETKRSKISVHKNAKKIGGGGRMSRSKSTSNHRHVSKSDKINEEKENNFYNRARILSPIPALSAIQQQSTNENTKQTSTVTVLPKPIQLSTPTSASVTNARNTRANKPLSAPAVLTTAAATTTTTTVTNQRATSPPLPTQRPKLPLNYNRQSYPPDMTLLTQSNTIRNRNSYTLVPIRTVRANNNNNTSNNAIVYSNKNNVNRLSYTQPPSKPLTTTTSIPIKNEFSDFSYENRQPLIRRYPTSAGSPSNSSSSSNSNYQAPPPLPLNNINGVRLRHSRHSNSTSNSDNKPKRSLSAISTSSTKKSVRFADSVGLELENIFNLSSFDVNKPTVMQNSAAIAAKNHLVFNSSNDKENSLYENHTLPTYYNNQHSNNRFQINLSPSDHMNDTAMNNEVYTNTKAAAAMMMKSNHLNKSNNNFVVKTLKLANLTIRTRINTNGKLESEV